MTASEKCGWCAQEISRDTAAVVGILSFVKAKAHSSDLPRSWDGLLVGFSDMIGQCFLEPGLGWCFIYIKLLNDCQYVTLRKLQVAHAEDFRDSSSSREGE